MRWAVAMLCWSSVALATPVARLPRTFTPSAYRAQLALDEHHFTGHIEIDGELTGNTVWLSSNGLEIARATELRDGLAIPLVVEQHADDQMLALTGATPGHAMIAIDYRGRVFDYEGKNPKYPDADRLTHGVFRRVVDGRTYFFTQSEPIGAREIFPCLDEPDRKVPWQLVLDVPAVDIALANAPLARETRLDARHIRYAFAPTLPLPSYLIAFAVGAFDLVDGGATRGAVPIRFAVQRGDTRITPELAATVRTTIATMEDYLATPFPYPKLDIVAVPQLGLGAMENAGLITYDVTLLANGGPSGVLAHELAHQWFGDLVTFAWWDDIWLAEVFASSLPGLAARADSDDAVASPRFAHLQPLRMEVTRESLAAFDVTYGHPIIDFMESKVGAAAFRRGLQHYLRGHAHGNATSADLFASIDAAAGMQLAPTYDAIANRWSGPSIVAEVECKAGHGTLALLRDAQPWPLPVCISYGDKHTRVDRCVALDREMTTLPTEGCPTWFLSDSAYDIHSQGSHALLSDGWSWLTEAERRAVLETLDEPVDELAAIGKLLGDRRAQNAIASHLDKLTQIVAPGLRARFDTWVIARFGALTTGLDLGALAYNTYGLASLLGHAGEPNIVAQAQRMTSPTGRVTFVDGIVADRDPLYAAKLFARLRSAAGVERTSLLSPLYTSHFAVDLVIEDPHRLEPLTSHEQLLLCAAWCDVAHRDAIVKLFVGREGESQIKQSCDLSIGAQRTLEPAFRALLAH